MGTITYEHGLGFLLYQMFNIFFFLSTEDHIKKIKQCMFSIRAIREYSTLNTEQIMFIYGINSYI